VPAAAGVFSALGLLEAEEAWHVSRSIFQVGSRVDPAELGRHYADLEAALRADLRANGSDNARIEWGADVRYAQQGYELAVDVDRATPPRALVAQLRERFDAAHARAYGHASERDEVEVVTLRVSGRIPRDSSLSRVTRAEEPAGVWREVWFGPSVGRLEVPIVGRASLRQPAAGPFLVEEFDTTTVVPPGWQAALDGERSIVLEHVA
jgi:N-methylhydantoinase A